MKRIISDEKKMNLKNNLIIALLILACMALFYYLFSNAVHKFNQAFMAVFVPAIIGLFISYLCEPLYVIFCDKLKIKKQISVFLTTFIVVALIGLLMFLIGKFAVEQIELFLQNDFPKILDSIDAFAKSHGYNGIEEVIENARNNVENVISSNGNLNIFAFIGGAFRSIKNFIINFALVLIFFIYFLFSRGLIFKGLLRIVPKKHQHHFEAIGTRSDEVIHSFVKGKFIAIIFLILYFIIMFEIIGLKGAGIMFAIMLGLLDIIPIVGPIAGTIIPVVFTFILRDSYYLNWGTPIAILLIVIIGQFLQEKVISPLVIGKQMNINSLLLLTSMVFFSSLFGILGIILAIPICGVIKVVFTYIKETLFTNEEQDEKNVVE